MLLLLSVVSLWAGRQTEPWQPAQLIEPAQLAAKLTSADSTKPLILSIGPAASIKTSVAIGPAGEAESLVKLETLLRSVDKGQEIVIYCGCCPFKHCPNVRPAFALLNQMGFRNHKLLNLANNLKVDWIDKGYPVNE